MTQPIIISFISGALLAAIVIAFIFSPSFRADILAGEGKTELFGILSVQGAVVIVLIGIFMGGLLFPLTRLSPPQELVEAREKIESLNIALLKRQQEIELLKKELKSPGIETVKVYIEQFMMVKSLLGELQVTEQLAGRETEHMRRARLIQARNIRWVNGTTLHVAFMDGNKRIHDIVKKAGAEWVKDTGLRFEFGSTPEDAEIRITFYDGNWSYSGTEALNVPVSEPTMSIERSPGLSDDEYQANAMMFFGHVLGFNKEYRNPNADIPWNREAVYLYFANLGLSDKEVDAAIFRRVDMDPHEFDPKSIMMPYFPKELFQGDFELRRNLTLSEVDKERAQRFYPPPADESELRPLESPTLYLEPGEQKELVMHPSETRVHEIAAFGDLDTLLAVFEEAEGQKRLLAQNKDSGEDLNKGMSARVKLKLYEDRKYVLRVSFRDPGRAGETAVMFW